MLISTAVLLLSLLTAAPILNIELQTPVREFTRVHHAGDCNTNGIADDRDIALGISQDCNTNGSPDECDTAMVPRPSTVFLPPSGRVDEAYGLSVALDGDVAVIGAMQEDCDAGTNCGAAYVYRFNGTGWQLDARLIASDQSPGAWFGSNVAISGNAILIGAQLASCAEGDACGAAYVFRYDGSHWSEDANLVLTDAHAHDLFGHSVAVHGDVALIGFGTGWRGRDGAVQAYHFNGIEWIPESRLAGSMSATRDVVALTDDVAVLWADQDTCGSNIRCGAAYIFHHQNDTWIEEARLVPEFREEHQGFGASAALSGETLLISAPSEDHTSDAGEGAVYVFKYNSGTWTETTKIVAPDAAMAEKFGFSIALEGNTALIGSWGTIEADCFTGDRDWCGAAYVFRFDGTNWLATDRLTSRGFARTSNFGLSVALSQNRTLIGACSAGDVISVDCGSAFSFEIPSRDCNSNGTPDECESNTESNLADFAIMQSEFTDPGTGP